MALTVKRSKGILVEYGGTGIVLDPTRNSKEYPAFVSHAHADHAAAFKHSDMIKYATEQTHRLLEILNWKNLGNWNPIKIGDSIKIDDIEVKVHNAGHVIGSIQFEIRTPEGTILYTGDFAQGNSYTMKSAPPIHCDLLIIETTFGAPQFRFPKRKDVSLEMVRWAILESIPKGLIPTFRTDAIGNAQEIISAFNKLTNLPVVTAKNATKVSDVYQQYGHKLDYVDIKTSEGKELIESGRCLIITPKGAKLKYDNLSTALASGWANMMGHSRRAFPLSDHADFNELLNFIRKCNPKRVLTFHGGKITRDFHKIIQKRLKINAKPLTNSEETIHGTIVRQDIRMKAGYNHILRIMRIPGFEYTSPWLIKEMAKKGFTRGETGAALQHLVERKILETTLSGVRLNQH